MAKKIAFLTQLKLIRETSVGFQLGIKLKFSLNFNLQMDRRGFNSAYCKVNLLANSKHS
jgi:hypothetical protein